MTSAGSPAGAAGVPEHSIAVILRLRDHFSTRWQQAMQRLELGLNQFSASALQFKTDAQIMSTAADQVATKYNAMAAAMERANRAAGGGFGRGARATTPSGRRAAPRERRDPRDQRPPSRPAPLADETPRQTEQRYRKDVKRWYKEHTGQPTRTDAPHPLQQPVRETPAPRAPRAPRREPAPAPPQRGVGRPPNDPSVKSGMLSDNQALHDQARELPDRHGVYKFFDKDDKFLYAGKADKTTLKQRVPQHFGRNRNARQAEIDMMKEVHRMEWIETETGEQAAELERQVVRGENPIWNERLRQDRAGRPGARNFSQYYAGRGGRMGYVREQMGRSGAALGFTPETMPNFDFEGFDPDTHKLDPNYDIIRQIERREQAARDRQPGRSAAGIRPKLTQAQQVWQAHHRQVLELQEQERLFELANRERPGLEQGLGFRQTQQAALADQTTIEQARFDKATESLGRVGEEPQPGERASQARTRDTAHRVRTQSGQRLVKLDQEMVANAEVIEKYQQQIAHADRLQAQYGGQAAEARRNQLAVLNQKRAEAHLDVLDERAFGPELRRGHGQTDPQFQIAQLQRERAGLAQRQQQDDRIHARFAREDPDGYRDRPDWKEVDQRRTERFIRMDEIDQTMMGPLGGLAGRDDKLDAGADAFNRRARGLRQSPSGQMAMYLTQSVEGLMGLTAILSVVGMAVSTAVMGGIEAIQKYREEVKLANRATEQYELTMRSFNLALGDQGELFSTRNLSMSKDAGTSLAGTGRVGAIGAAARGAGGGQYSADLSVVIAQLRAAFPELFGDDVEGGEQLAAQIGGKLLRGGVELQGVAEALEGYLDSADSRALLEGMEPGAFADWSPDSLLRKWTAGVGPEDRRKIASAREQWPEVFAEGRGTWGDRLVTDPRRRGGTPEIGGVPIYSEAGYDPGLADAASKLLNLGPDADREDLENAAADFQEFVEAFREYHRGTREEIVEDIGYQAALTAVQQALMEDIDRLPTELVTDLQRQLDQLGVNLDLDLELNIPPPAAPAPAPSPSDTGVPIDAPEPVAPRSGRRRRGMPARDGENPSPGLTPNKMDDGSEAQNPRVASGEEKLGVPHDDPEIQLLPIYPGPQLRPEDTMPLHPNDIIEYEELLTPRARGGRVQPGEITLVGEEGPEIVKLPAGAEVMPYAESQSYYDKLMYACQDLGIIPRARGGRVGAGEVSLVGEEGPEIVRMATGAEVFPNGKAPSFAPDTKLTELGWRDIDRVTVNQAHETARSIGDFLWDVEDNWRATFEKLTGMADDTLNDTTERADSGVGDTEPVEIPEWDWSTWISDGWSKFTGFVSDVAGYVWNWVTDKIPDWDWTSWKDHAVNAWNTVTGLASKVVKWAVNKVKGWDWENWKTIAVNAFGVVTGLAGTVVQWATNVIPDWNWGGWAQKATDAWNIVYGYARTAVEWVVNTVRDWGWGKWEEIATDAWGIVYGYSQKAVEWVINTVRDWGWTSWEAIATTAWKIVTGYAATTVEWAINTVRGWGWDTWQQKATTAWEIVKGYAGTVVDWVVNTVRGWGWDSWEAVATTAWKIVTGYAGTVVNWVVNTVREWGWNTWEQVATTAWKIVTGYAGTVVSWAINTVKGWGWEKWEETATDAWDIVKGYAGTVVQWATNAIPEWGWEDMKKHAVTQFGVLTGLAATVVQWAPNSLPDWGWETWKNKGVTAWNALMGVVNKPVQWVNRTIPDWDWPAWGTRGKGLFDTAIEKIQNFEFKWGTGTGNQSGAGGTASIIPDLGWLDWATNQESPIRSAWATVQGYLKATFGDDTWWNTLLSGVPFLQEIQSLIDYIFGEDGRQGPIKVNQGEGLPYTVQDVQRWGSERKVSPYLSHVNKTHARFDRDGVRGFLQYESKDNFNEQLDILLQRWADQQAQGITQGTGATFSEAREVDGEWMARYEYDGQMTTWVRSLEALQQEISRIDLGITPGDYDYGAIPAPPENWDELPSEGLSARMEEVITWMKALGMYAEKAGDDFDLTALQATLTAEQFALVSAAVSGNENAMRGAAAATELTTHDLVALSLKLMSMKKTTTEAAADFTELSKALGLTEEQLYWLKSMADHTGSTLEELAALTGLTQQQLDLLRMAADSAGVSSTEFANILLSNTHQFSALKATTQQMESTTRVTTQHLQALGAMLGLTESQLEKLEGFSGKAGVTLTQLTDTLGLTDDQVNILQASALVANVSMETLIQSMASNSGQLNTFSNTGVSANQKLIELITSIANNRAAMDALSGEEQLTEAQLAALRRTFLDNVGKFNELRDSGVLTDDQLDNLRVALLANEEKLGHLGGATTATQTAANTLKTALANNGKQFDALTKEVKDQTMGKLIALRTSLRNGNTNLGNMGTEVGKLPSAVGALVTAINNLKKKVDKVEIPKVTVAVTKKATEKPTSGGTSAPTPTPSTVTAQGDQPLEGGNKFWDVWEKNGKMWKIARKGRGKDAAFGVDISDDKIRAAYAKIGTPLPTYTPEESGTNPTPSPSGSSTPSASPSPSPSTGTTTASPYAGNEHWEILKHISGNTFELQDKNTGQKVSVDLGDTDSAIHTSYAAEGRPLPPLPDNTPKPQVTKVSGPKVLTPGPADTSFADTSGIWEQSTQSEDNLVNTITGKAVAKSDLGSTRVRKEYASRGQWLPDFDMDYFDAQKHDLSEVELYSAPEPGEYQTVDGRNMPLDAPGVANEKLTGDDRVLTSFRTWYNQDKKKTHHGLSYPGPGYMMEDGTLLPWSTNRYYPSWVSEDFPTQGPIATPTEVKSWTAQPGRYVLGRENMKHQILPDDVWRVIGMPHVGAWSIWNPAGNYYSSIRFAKGRSFISSVMDPDRPYAMLAKGGTVINSGGAIVGERGPEMLNLPRGAQVAPLPPGSYNAARHSGGAGHQTFEINLNVEGERMKTVVLDMLDDVIRERAPSLMQV